MSCRSPHWLLVGLISLSLATSARAATFDLIWADHLTVTNPGITGFSLSSDVLLIVNKGTTDITSAELAATAIGLHCSNPAVTAISNIENAGSPTTPIHSNEAVGRVSAFNGVLATKLFPDETLHNVPAAPVFSFFMRFPSDFLGSVVLDITMTLGGDQAQYSMLVDFVSGPTFNVEFPSASRVSGVPLATSSVATTWGRLKNLYR